VVPTFGGVLAAGAVRVDRLSLCVVVPFAFAPFGDRGAWSFRIAEGNFVPAGPRTSRASCHLDASRNPMEMTLR
jgi:hypothetical protein